PICARDRATVVPHDKLGISTHAVKPTRGSTTGRVISRTGECPRVLAPEKSMRQEALGSQAGDSPVCRPAQTGRPVWPQPIRRLGSRLSIVIIVCCIAFGSMAPAWD